MRLSSISLILRHLSSTWAKVVLPTASCNGLSSGLVAGKVAPSPNWKRVWERDPEAVVEAGSEMLLILGHRMDCRSSPWDQLLVLRECPPLGCLWAPCWELDACRHDVSLFSRCVSRRKKNMLKAGKELQSSFGALAIYSLFGEDDLWQGPAPFPTAVAFLSGSHCHRDILCDIDLYS